MLIFDTFLRVKSANKTVRYFNEKELRLPRYDRFRELHWRKPTVAAILSTLKNPAYAGAFAYGRSRVVRNGPSPTDKSMKKVSQQEWKVLVRDKYPAYVNWETFEKIQSMLKDNYAEYDRNKTRGVPRPGEALLHGIVYCGECGHKMVVQYKKGTQYLCNYVRQQYGTPVCQRIPGNPVDIEVVEKFFQVISPIELDAYSKAIALQTQADASIQKAHLQQLERLRYQVKLAERQFNQVDPDNRLVASELEKRWENTLRELRHAEESFAQQKEKIAVISLPEELRLAFIDVGKNLPALWNKTVSQQQKKAFLRCLIDKVVIHRSESDIVHTRIVWKGGETTTIKIPVAVGSLSQLSFAKEMEDKIVELSQSGRDDKEIAEHLTNNGFRSPMGCEVLLNTVKSIRLKRRILKNRAQSHPRFITGFLTISQVAQITNISAHWIYDRIHNGQIKVIPTYLPQYKKGLYLFPDNEETINMFHGLKNGNFQNLRFS